MTELSTIEKICAIGCNITVNYSDYPLHSLERLATISKGRGILTLKKCSKGTSASLERLATIGEEHIHLDFTE